jgi:hypothetical protein
MARRSVLRDVAIPPPQIRRGPPCHILVKIIKAIYNFIVGDMIILVGVIITFIILALINDIGFLAPLRVASGAILIIAVLIILVTTLNREIRG